MGAELMNDTMNVRLAEESTVGEEVLKRGLGGKVERYAR